MTRALGAAVAGVLAYAVTLVGLYLALVEFGTMWFVNAPSWYLLAGGVVMQVLAAAAAGGLAGWIQDSAAPRWQSALVILLAPILVVVIGLWQGPDPRTPLWYHALSVLLAFGVTGGMGYATLTRFGP